MTDSRTEKWYCGMFPTWILERTLEMKLGIFGGTFDPVHYGHLILAETCREACGLDEIWFVPASDPPHKDAGGITPGTKRVEMLEFALSGCSYFHVNRMELQRSGTSYTVETLREIHRDNPEDSLYFLIGGDSLRDLPDWREPEEIAQLATIVAVNRGEAGFSGMREVSPEFQQQVLDQIQQVEIPRVDISASEMRERVRNGRSIRFLTPRAVEVYIEQQQLYRN